MTFGDGSGVYEHIGNLDQSGADGLVKASIDAGINFLDTADIYSPQPARFRHLRP